MADQNSWAAVPFHFWSVVYFVFGSIVGSFLNVCIHRMPRGESVVSPPSHCPHCGYSIPWFLNIPLVTWCWLRGKCANCRAPISARYFAVELFVEPRCEAARLRAFGRPASEQRRFRVDFVEILANGAVAADDGFVLVHQDRQLAGRVERQ